MVPPSEPTLMPFVQVFGYLEAPLGDALERVLPSGGMQLLVNLDRDEIRTYRPEALPGRNARGVTPARRHSGTVLQGPYDRWSMIDTAAQRAIAWVAFRPAGAYPFFGAASRDTRSALVDLDALWGRGAVRLRERLLAAPGAAARLQVLERALLARAVGSLRPEPVVRYATAALEQGATVAHVIDRSGMSARGFGRLFTDHVGLTPKRFSRVRRFQRLLNAVAKACDFTRVPTPSTRDPLGPAPAPDWALLAAEAGYYDQAHMIHDFQAFSGLRPTAYRPRSATELNHVPV
ncbi:MAG: DUF6597 domain-containing transcriptional factor [Micromonosporaceae bacterium]